MTRRRRVRATTPPKTEQQLVDELADAIGIPREQRGGLIRHKVVDMDGALGGVRNGIATVLLNRGGTAVERWMMSDRIGLFAEGQQRAIRYTQGLWARAEGRLRAVDPTRDVIDIQLDGMSQQEALDELQRFKTRIPRPYWNVFENVCRFDEEAGAAGSRISTNSRSAVDAAKTTVAFTASLIAMWRHL